MYRKHHNGQLSIEEFHVPFGGTLDPENRWVLDAAARPLAPCRLVARSMAAGHARQLQASYGAESLWWA
jgi:hypothetical protein